MFIFNKKKSAPIADQAPTQNEVNELEPVASDIADSTLSRVNIFNKFRNKEFGSVQVYSYENESWAPEYESSGLFRKRRANVEEQVSSSSGTQ